jgi:hypothetical protein
MVKLNRLQRESLYRVFLRTNDGQENLMLAYKKFRKTVQPGPGCVMVHWCGMWLGIEPDGYTHS